MRCRLACCTLGNGVEVRCNRCTVEIAAADLLCLAVRVTLFAPLQPTPPSRLRVHFTAEASSWVRLVHLLGCDGSVVPHNTTFDPDDHSVFLEASLPQGVPQSKIEKDLQRGDIAVGGVLFHSHFLHAVGENERPLSCGPAAVCKLYLCDFGARVEQITVMMAPKINCAWDVGLHGVSESIQPHWVRGEDGAMRLTLRQLSAAMMSLCCKDTPLALILTPIAASRKWRSACVILLYILGVIVPFLALWRTVR